MKYVPHDGWLGVLWATIGCLLSPVPWSGEFSSARAAEPKRPGYVDTHAHLDGKYFARGSFQKDYDGAAQVALSTMDNLGIDKTLLMPPPFAPGQRQVYDYAELAEVARKNPERFAFLGGGGSLNPMIQEALRAGSVSEETRRKFTDKAEEIVRAGALGFGEMTAEHLSFNEDHPYEAAPPDHPLFLLLADIAAKHHVPIDLHMEAVARDMAVPQRFTSPNNPKTIRENVKAFERLLAHKREAKIVWCHFGWDNTGDRTAALTRRLLKEHPNLLVSVKMQRQGLLENNPMDENRELRPEWLALVRDFPDRILIGSDQFYASPKSPRKWPESSQGPRLFLSKLPSELAQKVAVENAARIYRLK